VWSGICTALGLLPDTGAANEPQPPLRTPTRIAWTRATFRQIADGNIKRGAFVAMNCTACHGEEGRSSSGLYPTLAGMDAAVIYKQLDDFRASKRLWGAMNGVGEALSPQASSDVAAYFASRTNGLASGDDARTKGDDPPRAVCPSLRASVNARNRFCRRCDALQVGFQPGLAFDDCAPRKGDLNTKNFVSRSTSLRFRASAWRTQGTGEIRSRAEPRAKILSSTGALICA
jgi:cytochrome c553